MKTTAKVVATMCMGLFCGATLAGGGGMPEDKFKAMDSNNDGMLSSAEHATGASAMFTAMDTNHDNMVSAAEMDAHHKAKMKGAKDMSSAEKIRMLDTDKDGQLSMSEHDAGARTMFSRMDADGNGSLSKAEMHSGHHDMDKPAGAKSK